MSIQKSIFPLVLIIVLSGCLKTRSQISKDDDLPAPEEPTPVQTQGSLYALDEIRSEITKLTGRIEDLERHQNAPTPEIDELSKLSLEARVKRLEKEIQNLTANPQTGAAAPLTQAPDPETIWVEAQSFFKAQDYSQTYSKCTQYLEYENASQKEAATLLKAESLSLLGDHKKAILEHSKFLEKFPKSKSAARSLFAIGQSFDALGLQEDAIPFYQEITEKHPRSEEAKKASALLKSRKSKRSA